MEYIIHILAVFIALGFLLKVGFYHRWGVIATAIGCALFVWWITPWITELSQPDMAAFFASRSQMLDLSVGITLEAAFMITFCFNCFAETRNRNTWLKQLVTKLLRIYPGIIIGGVLCYVLALLLFSFPGMDFDNLRWIMSVATLLFVCGGSWLLKYSIGNEPLRLEVLFIVNLFIVLLSIIVTGY